MKEISSFFDKFKNSALKELNKREIIASSLYKIVKIKIEIKDLDIKNGILYIKGSQMLKSEIFLKKKIILDSFGKNNIKIIDIK